MESWKLNYLNQLANDLLLYINIRYALIKMKTLRAKMNFFLFTINKIFE